MAIGIKNGDTFENPFPIPFACSSSIVDKPPIPLDTITPQRSVSSVLKSMPLSLTASSAAATASWVNLAILLASFLPIISSGLKSFTSPASFTGKSLVSKDFISPIPHSFALTLFHESSTLFPSGLTVPIPVITTLLFIMHTFPAYLSHTLFCLLLQMSYMLMPPSTAMTWPVM